MPSSEGYEHTTVLKTLPLRLLQRFSPKSDCRFRLRRLGGLMAAAMILSTLLLSGLPSRCEAVFGTDQQVLGGVDIADAGSALNKIRNTALAISSDGIIFVAVVLDPNLPGETLYRIGVYRSDDGGDTWHLWGQTVSNVQLTKPRLRVIPTGTGDLLYLGYDEVGFGVILARANVSETTPTWVAGSVPAGQVGDFDFVSDVKSHPDFVLHLAWAAAGTLYYSRSTDQGGTWSTPYALSSNGYVFDASLAWGHNDLLHCLYTVAPEPGTLPNIEAYRHAGNRVADGLTDWSASDTVWSPGTTGDWMRNPSIAAQTTSSYVLAAFAAPQSGYMQIDMSTDDGGTWNAGNLLDQYGDMYIPNATEDNPELLAVSGTGGFEFSAHGYGPTGLDLWKSGPTDPMNWSDPIPISNHDAQAYEVHLATDPHRGWLVAVVWPWDHVADPSTQAVFFNAEWLGTPGFPVFDPGPVYVIDPPTTPPGFRLSWNAFGDLLGNIHLMSADGSEAPGWPVSAGQLLPAVQVGPAMGDMDLDGKVEVAEGNASGQVHLFEQDGSEPPGWPVDLGTQSDVYACLASMEGDHTEQVVACSGDEIHVLDISGQEVSGYPVNVGRQISGPPSIGDLDGNDTLEVAFPTGTGLQVNDGISPCFYVDEGFPVSRQVELADLDGNGKPELIVVGETGEVDVRLGDGTRAAGSWPFVTLNKVPVTEVAVGDLDGDGNPDLVFADAGWNVYALHADGTALSGWPVALGPGQDLPGSPVIADLDSTGAEVVLGMTDGKVRALHADGTEVFGWPKDVGSAVREPVAVGDVDGDGLEEVEVLSDSTFSLIGVNDVPVGLSKGMWAMAGAVPERTGCLDCMTEPNTGVQKNGTPEPAFAFSVSELGAGRVVLTYTLPTSARVNLTLYDVSGRRVWTLPAGAQSLGAHRLEWDGRTGSGTPAASGIYYARLQVRGTQWTRTASRKVALLR